MWFGIPTPDQSLIPQLVSLVGFGTALAFGWLIHRQADLIGVWAKQWPLNLGGRGDRDRGVLVDRGPDADARARGTGR